MCNRSVSFANFISNVRLRFEQFLPDWFGDTQLVFAVWTSPRNWQVDVTTQDGSVVYRSFTGSGTRVAVEWDGTDTNGFWLAPQLLWKETLVFQRRCGKLGPVFIPCSIQPGLLERRKSMNLRCLVFLAVAMIAVTSRANWLDQLGLRRKPASASAEVAALSPDQMTQGLREALGQGVERAVRTLGRDGGFLTNLSVRIPMPEKLQTAEKTLRALGQNQLADDFIASMNRAAEKAVPEAAAVFGDAIQQMTVSDARSILTGPDDAATQFFRRTTETNLYARFFPHVQKATEQVGVTSRYKQMTGKAEAAASLGGLLGGGKKTAASALDLDGYVTQKALDGLFKTVADEEKRIRENPLARSTDLLQKVFGSLGK